MIKHIDILMTDYSMYNVLQHFTTKFYEALMRAGIRTKLFFFDKPNTEIIIKEMLEDPADYTMSFNGTLPNPQGVFLCDVLKIPHICYLVDLPQHFFF